MCIERVSPITCHFFGFLACWKLEKDEGDCTQTTSPTASSKGPLRGYSATTLSHPLHLATLDFPGYNGQLAGIAVPSSPATVSPVVIHKTGCLRQS